EAAHLRVFFEATKFSPLFATKMLRSGINKMVSFGYTTMQEGRASSAQILIMKLLAFFRMLPVDLNAYADFETGKKYLPQTSLKYVNRFRVAGMKLTLDGSPQGKTAWRDRPYVVPPHNHNSDYVGYPSVEKQKVLEQIALSYESNWQIGIHANGEAAIDLFLEGTEYAENLHGKKDRRPILIHGQFMRKDHIKKIKNVGAVPSVFPSHTFYWGEWHKNETIGKPGVFHISPTKWLEDENIIFTVHHDAPVIIPDSMKVLWSTVNRISRKGEIIGTDQRISVITALKALTLWGAYQYFEEDSKGSIEVGKLADFVILSDNPLTINPMELNTIKVLETIKEGKSIYKLSM
ncbi:MAG: amidohydrolase, partial [Brevinema sp.]